MSWPAHEERNPDRGCVGDAFIDHPMLGPKIAVVRSKEGERPAVLVEGFESSKDLTHQVIDRHEGPQLRSTDGSTGRERLARIPPDVRRLVAETLLQHGRVAVPARDVRGSVLGFCDIRSMGRRRRQIEQPRAAITVTVRSIEKPDSVPPNEGCSVCVDGLWSSIDVPGSTSITALTEGKGCPAIKEGRIASHAPAVHILAEDGRSITVTLQVMLDCGSLTQLTRVAVRSHIVVVSVPSGKDGGS